jgi:hypothetical protein
MVDAPVHRHHDSVEAVREDAVARVQRAGVRGLGRGARPIWPVGDAGYEVRASEATFYLGLRCQSTGLQSVTVEPVARSPLMEACPLSR